MMKNGDYPYWNEQAYQDTLASKANYLVLMLGTNDAKTFQYNQTEYVADYISMVKSFQAMTPTPDIFIMIPPPLYINGVYSMN